MLSSVKKIKGILRTTTVRDLRIIDSEISNLHKSFTEYCTYLIANVRYY